LKLHGIGTDTWYKREPVVCADGYKISIQASSTHYSSPRSTAKKYKACELGYPSEADELINSYAESEDYTSTIYPYVPAKVIQALLEKHGGVVSGECPLLDLTESEEE
jgi:hypothetical protein